MTLLILVFCSCLLKGCPSIESITFPDSVTKITHIESFSYSPNLEEIIFEGIEELSIGCFMCCKKLKTVKLGNKLMELPYKVFDNCSSLVNIELPKTLKNIGGKAFYQCTSLSKIIIPSGVKIIEEYSFIGCKDLHGNIFFEGPCPNIPSLKCYPPIFPKHMNTDYNKIHVKPKFIMDFFNKGYFKKYRLIPEKSDQLSLDIIEDGKYKVIPKLDSQGNNLYIGDIYVPKTIVINNKLIEITEVDDFSFAFCPNLKSVEIDEGIKLGNHLFLSSPECQKP